MDHIYFLISICNDCYRINTLHLPELLRIESRIEWSDNTKQLIKNVNSNFQEVSELSLKSLTRIIFHDLTDIITHFDKLWLKLDNTKTKLLSFSMKNKSNSSSTNLHPSNISPVQTIITTIDDYFNDIKPCIELTLFYQLVTSCVEICILRYILFIKDLSIQHKVLTGNQVLQLQLDLVILIDGFKKHCPYELHHNCNSMTLYLNTLADIISLVTISDTTDSSFLLALQKLVHQKKSYTADENLILKEALNILLSLRLDCRGDSGTGALKRNELVQYAFTPLNSNNSSTTTTNNNASNSNNAADSLLLKVFNKKDCGDENLHLFSKIFHIPNISNSASSNGNLNSNGNNSNGSNDRKN